MERIGWCYCPPDFPKCFHSFSKFLKETNLSCNKIKSILIEYYVLKMRNPWSFPQKAAFASFTISVLSSIFFFVFNNLYGRGNE